MLADDRHADWLLWLRPELAGRIAYDVRFELFSAAELERIKLLEDSSRAARRRCGAGVSVVTFAPGSDMRVARRECVRSKS